jgi:hypothetical protein
MFRLMLFIAFALVVLAFTFLKWWQLLIVAAVLLLLGKFIAQGLLVFLCAISFRARGKVLRGATIEVHRVQAALTRFDVPAAGQARLPAAFADDEGRDFLKGAREPDPYPDDEPDVPRTYYKVELTITPHSPTGSFKHWDIDDLMLVRPDLHWNADDDDACEVISVGLVRKGTMLLDKPASKRHAKHEDYDEDDYDDEDYDPDDYDDDNPQVIGPQRLKLFIAVQPEIRELVFKYYFERFGSLKIPA